MLSGIGVILLSPAATEADAVSVLKPAIPTNELIFSSANTMILSRWEDVPQEVFSSHSSMAVLSVASVKADNYFFPFFLGIRALP